MGSRPSEEDYRQFGRILFNVALRLEAQDGAPQGPDEDVEMGGMEDQEEMADNITVAPTPEEPSQPPPPAGGQAARGGGRRGSRVPSGIFAL